MKKVFSAVMVCLAVIFIAGTVGAFDAPGGALYGVTSDGTYFISTDLVTAANGSAPKAMVEFEDYERQAMTLDGNYYIYKSGEKMEASEKVHFCFDIGGDRYIPHALRKKTSIQANVVKNGRGGYNFYMLPK